MYDIGNILTQDRLSEVLEEQNTIYASIPAPTIGHTTPISP